jgi:hypothetical protein
MGTSPGATLGFRVLTGHPEKLIDYATRSTNLMTVRANQSVRAPVRHVHKGRTGDDAVIVAGELQSLVHG